MKVTKSTKQGGKSKVEIVVRAADGHAAATAPVVELVPIRFRIKKILVPVDFSEPSEKAMHYAKEFAQQFDAALTLLHVVEPIIYPAELGYVPLAPEDLEKGRLDGLRKRLSEMAAGLGSSVKVDSLLRLGRSWKEVVDLAKNDGYDMIILATHGYTGVKHALLGSVAEKVVRHAPCPVLVVRTEERDFA
jgi:universal stress protein A